MIYHYRGHAIVADKLGFTVLRLRGMTFNADTMSEAVQLIDDLS